MNKFYTEDSNGNTIQIEYKDKEALQNMIFQAKAVLGFDMHHECNCRGNCEDRSSIVVPKSGKLGSFNPEYTDAEAPEVVPSKSRISSYPRDLELETNVVYKKEPRSVRLFLGVCCESEQYKVREYFDEEVHCRICNDKFDIKNLVITESVCPNCDNRAVFMTSKSTIQHHCKECKSPIDLKYIEKANKILSVNLVK